MAGSLAEEFELVYVSSTVLNDLNPRWPKARIPLARLAKGPERRAQILFEVWDKDHVSKDDLIGSVRCHLEDIQSGLELSLTASSPVTRGPSPARSSSGQTRASLGSLVIEKQRVEFKYFRPGGNTNAWLIRYYAEHVWQLPPPQVLLSISGGEDDYSLETSTQDALLFNMMEMTMKLDAWLITNGSCTGFAKTVGAYRAKFAVTTPLIGICAAPPESEALNPARGGAPGVCPKASGDSRGSLRGSAGWMENIDAHLDRNHSHFILASNTDKAASQQLAQLRSKFESCVGQNHGWRAVQSAIHTTLLEHDVEWPEDLEPGSRQHASAILPSRAPGLLSTVWAAGSLSSTQHRPSLLPWRVRASCCVPVADGSCPSMLTASCFIHALPRSLLHGSCAPVECSPVACLHFSNADVEMGMHAAPWLSA